MAPYGVTRPHWVKPNYKVQLLYNDVIPEMCCVIFAIRIEAVIISLIQACQITLDISVSPMKVFLKTFR